MFHVYVSRVTVPFLLREIFRFSLWISLNKLFYLLICIFEIPWDSACVVKIITGLRLVKKVQSVFGYFNLRKSVASATKITLWLQAKVCTETRLFGRTRFRLLKDDFFNIQPTIGDDNDSSLASLTVILDESLLGASRSEATEVQSRKGTKVLLSLPEREELLLKRYKKTGWRETLKHTKPAKRWRGGKSASANNRQPYI